MNDSQQIFAVLYAIFWGGIFNVLSRWKPFNFGLIFDKEVKHVSNRTAFACFMLNIIPIIYFVFIFWCLESRNICNLKRNEFYNIFKIILTGIIPSFAIFGFYRLWIGIIEKWPTRFYAINDNIPRIYKSAEPSLEEMKIIPSNEYSRWKNIGIGASYIIFCGLGCKWVWVGIIFILVLPIIILLYQKRSIGRLNKLKRFTKGF